MAKDAKSFIQNADDNVDEWRDHIQDSAQVFHDREGTLFEREEGRQLLEDELDIREELATECLSNLVGDIVDPVIQVNRHVGVVEFVEFDGAYGYINFDDKLGKQKRVVCAQCVHQHERDDAVTNATEKDPSGSFNSSTSYEDLVKRVHDHYEVAHETIPKEVETGASLLSGTTIGGNTAFHQGNENQIDAGVSNHDQLSGVSANDHHSQNHGNADHSTNFLQQGGSTQSPTAATASFTFSHSSADGVETESRTFRVGYIVDTLGYNITQTGFGASLEKLVVNDAVGQKLAEKIDPDVDEDKTLVVNGPATEVVLTTESFGAGPEDFTANLTFNGAHSHDL
ncbi:MAG: hypothetical protein J07AB43_01340 [Candidatus Nanosalina sp. J07AB43]|jgi:hypothetical protein|nr:MAG: hypothetical protein J07AB43_01340 [Candidatus Nanosalina sp. J07AB43]